MNNDRFENFMKPPGKDGASLAVRVDHTSRRETMFRASRFAERTQRSEPTGRSFY
jgi:hypothetical protein